ncbi:putative G-protein coupled receptor 25 [Triplophysa tibetana]|uniref:Putative G-protein coupled receptor 25 n=1 Tax=Triplophysa tibetana TaxID=1572043 RepID=A0A5A9NFR3_9TELE|nr:putative G-protein coupled receptor 25 [Triplophysa tibetana]
MPIICAQMASSTEMAVLDGSVSSPDDYSFYDPDVTMNSTESYDYYISIENNRLPSSNIYIPVLYFIMFFVGFSGNLFVIVVIGNRPRHNRRLVDTFVLNLAFADLVFVLNLPLWAVSASHNFEWPFGEAMCKISSFIIAVNRFSNIFFLTCMSVDRYLAVVRLMDSHSLRSSNSLQITCSIVWIISFLLGIPSLVYRKIMVYQVCSEDSASSFVQGMNILTIFLTFMLPVVILGLCYGSILVNLRRHFQSAANSRKGARQRHSVKIVLTIILAFLISWLPFNVFKSIQVFFMISEREFGEDVEVLLYNGITVSCCLAFVNSCVNPAIYLILDKHFKHRAYILCLKCLGQRDTNQSNISSNSFSNGTTESYSGNTSYKGRRFSLTQNN